MRWEAMMIWEEMIWYESKWEDMIWEERREDDMRGYDMRGDEMIWYERRGEKSRWGYQIIGCFLTQHFMSSSTVFSRSLLFCPAIFFHTSPVFPFFYMHLLIYSKKRSYTCISVSKGHCLIISLSLYIYIYIHIYLTNYLSTWRSIYLSINLSI